MGKRELRNTRKARKWETSYCNEKTNRSEGMRDLLDDLFDLLFNPPDRLRRQPQQLGGGNLYQVLAIPHKGAEAHLAGQPVRLAHRLATRSACCLRRISFSPSMATTILAISSSCSCSAGVTAGAGFSFMTSDPRSCACSIWSGKAKTGGRVP